MKVIAMMAALGAAAAAHADVVTDWNTVYLDTIRAVGGPPCPISRAGAMMHVSMFEAVNSVDRMYEPYHAYLAAPSGASQAAAAAQAAHDVLVGLYPARAAIYDAALGASLAGIPDGQSKTDGIALGQASAAAMMAARAHDGTQTEPVYVFGTHPGDYRPTPPDFASPPANPGWGTTVPWTMIRPTQFRPDGPLHMRSMAALLHSRGYADQVNEVKAFGARNSAVRTEEQTRIAYFWANDVNGTYKPPGQLNTITQVVSADHGLTLQENARLFALINLAMADAGLVAWDAKYDTSIDLWRPVSAIRLADTDGNPRTEADPGWLPLNAFTPPFPSYVSGHATFGAAHGAVMADFFADRTEFTATTDEPLYTGGPRTYHRFSEAAWENAISRIYLGVHYRFDAEDGNRSGTALGHWVSSHMLRPVHPADFNRDGVVNAADFQAFVAAFQGREWRADVNHDGEVNAADAVLFARLYLGGHR